MSIVEHLVSVYAPHICTGCGREGRLACTACIEGIARPEPRCYRCHHPNPTGRTCTTCRAVSPLVSVNCATVYDGLAKELVKKLKFDRAQAAAGIMGSLLTEEYATALRGDVIIMPVPTANTRVRKRGYDQACLLARSLAKMSGRPYAPLLLRSGKQEQKGSSREQRHEQLHGAFTVRKPDEIRGARIILVDDVLTTGATLEQAAAVLIAAGARAVGGLVFARAE